MGSLLPGWDLDGCSHFNDNPSTKLLRLRTVSKGVAIKGGILLEGAGMKRSKQNIVCSLGDKKN